MAHVYKETLTPDQEKFVYELLCDPKRVLKAAGLRAGFSNPSYVYSLMRMEKIQKAIEAGEKHIQRDTGITPERIMRELSKIGFANLQDYADITESGASIKDIPRDQAAAITEFQSESTEGRGVNTRKSRIKLSDKRAALIDMGKQIGMFKDKVEVSGTLSFQQLVEESMKEIKQAPLLEIEDQT